VYAYKIIDMVKTNFAIFGYLFASRKMNLFDTLKKVKIENSQKFSKTILQIVFIYLSIIYSLTGQI